MSNGSDETDITGYPELEPEAEGVSTENTDDRPVLSQPYDWTISTLRDKYEKGQVDLQPHYQREYVWELKPELPSRLIESLLLEIPIPPIYFGKMPGGRLEVIDGQQRLTTLIRFVRNDFHLQKLLRMGSLNGKRFRELSEEHQAKVTDAPIRSIVIDAGNNQNLRYEVFERLNRGAMGLNEQELRNCVYRGSFCDLLAELENEQTWRRIKGTDKPESRFVEREMILRFFAFANRLNNYKGKLKSFLNDYMGQYAPRGEADLNAQANTFRQSMQNVWTVFGENSARLYSTGTEDRPSVDGRWEPKFSISALDIQASALIGQHAGKVQAAAEQIREMYIFYLLTQPQVRLAISRQPAGTAATKLRWTGFKAHVQQILDQTAVEPRFFTFEFRRQLFKAEPTCKICSNQIHCLEDSTVDHIHPYARGGRTVPENAQLAHRSCNARKSISLPSEDAAQNVSAADAKSSPS
jgi:5-methylcytosine-specific restriction endonuclease McrA